MLLDMNGKRYETECSKSDQIADSIIGGTMIASCVIGMIATAPVRIFGRGIEEMVHDCGAMGSAISAAHKRHKAEREAKKAAVAATQQ
jgi:hypothetical protein